MLVFVFLFTAYIGFIHFNYSRKNSVVLWNNKPKCPSCANQTPTQVYHHPSRTGLYRCKCCQTQFSIPFFACVAVAFLLYLGFVFASDEGGAPIGVVVFVAEDLG
jgi:prepilin signal peptidase PulO-like enzyme (type II secretory pathway)